MTFILCRSSLFHASKRTLLLRQRPVMASSSSFLTQQQQQQQPTTKAYFSTKKQPEKLPDAAVQASITKLSMGSPFPWTAADGNAAIRKTYLFQDFNQAWAFMSRSALLAEKMDHHPEWANVYNRVDVTLTTHDCDGVSLKDIAMAKAMEEYAAALMPFDKTITSKNEDNDE